MAWAKPWMEVSGVFSSCENIGHEVALRLLGGLHLVGHFVQGFAQLVNLAGPEGGIGSYVPSAIWRAESGHAVQRVGDPLADEQAQHDRQQQGNQSRLEEGPSISLRNIWRQRLNVGRGIATIR